MRVAAPLAHTLAGSEAGSRGAVSRGPHPQRNCPGEEAHIIPQRSVSQEDIWVKKK